MGRQDSKNKAASSLRQRGGKEKRTDPELITEKTMLRAGVNPDRKLPGSQERKINTSQTKMLTTQP